MNTCLEAYNNNTILIMSNPKHVLLELKCPLCLNCFVESEKVPALPVPGSANNGNHTSLIIFPVK